MVIFPASSNRLVPPPFEHRDHAAGHGPGVMAAARLVTDDVALAEHAPIAVGQLALEDEEVLIAGMDVRDCAGAGRHPHDVAALLGPAVEADRLPGDLWLQRPIEVV